METDLLDSEYFEIFKQENSDIICYPNPLYPGYNSYENYPKIDFEKFLKRKYPEKNIFKPEVWKPIEDYFDEYFKKNNYPMPSIFDNMKRKTNLIKDKSNGITVKISFNDLIYDQYMVGIGGPKNHNDIDNPVSIVKYNNQLILHDGYHRALVKMFRNKNEIEGYIMTLNSIS